MKKNLMLYLDLYEIWKFDVFSDISDLLEKTPDINIISFSKYWYVLDYYQQLLKNKIQSDVFMWVWDIYSDKKIYDNSIKNEWLFEVYTCLNDNNLKRKYINSIVLIDDLWDKYFRQYSIEKYEFIKNQLNILWSYLFVI